MHMITCLLLHSHNPYFNRWFSAILYIAEIKGGKRRHNPYFNRWFSAIIKIISTDSIRKKSQSLF